MDTHRSEQDPQQGRVKRLYDELESILRNLPEDRLEALRDYLNEQEEAQGPDAGGVSEEEV